MTHDYRRFAKTSLATLVLFLAPAPSSPVAAPGRSDEKPPAAMPGSVVVVPFVYLGNVDDVLTKSFVDRLGSPKDGWKMVDAEAMKPHLGKKVQLRSDAQMPVLLKAAKAAGAEAMILGIGANYKFMDAPGVRLRVRMISVATGTELHSGMAEETAWSVQGAKEEAAESAAKKLVKQFRAK